MPNSVIIGVLLILTAAGFFMGRRRSVAVAGTSGSRGLHSLPSHYGAYAAIWCAFPALAVFAIWSAMESTLVTELVVADLPADLRELPPERLGLVVNDIRNVANGHVFAGKVDPTIQAAADHYRSLERISSLALGAAVIGFIGVGAGWAWRSINPRLRARNRVDVVIKTVLVLSSSVAILTTLGIVLSLLFEALLFFRAIPFTDFLFGLHWSPQTAIRADQVGSTGAFGAVPLFAGTMMISGIAMLVAVPTGLLSAIYLSEYAGKRFRASVKPLLEILAGVPTVVYGYFAALTVAPTVRGLGEAIGLSVSSESALAAGLVMGIMIIPFVSSLSDDVINAVPQSLRDGSYAMGATQSETIRKVILPAALPGVVGGILLAVSRAIGETMIVVMAAGLTSNLTANPLEAVTTVTVQIVTLLTGDQEFDSPKTLAAFALGLLLFVSTLLLNVIALHIVRKYREQYD